MTTDDCARFVAFRMDPSVCNECGRLAEEHAPAAQETPEHMKALWRMALRLGGTWDTFGGKWGYGYNSGAVREHILACGFKWQAMNELAMDTQPEFAGTDCGSEWTSVLCGSIHCKCGQIRWTTWHVGHLTLGQLIWHAVREGEYPQEER